MDKKPAIHSHPQILSGVPVFVGTRVPVQTLLDYLEDGETLDVFLDHFPSVTHAQASSNKLKALLPLVPELRQTLGTIRPGEIVRIGG